MTTLCLLHVCGAPDPALNQRHTRACAKIYSCVRFFCCALNKCIYFVQAILSNILFISTIYRFQYIAFYARNFKNSCVARGCRRRRRPMSSTFSALYIYILLYRNDFRALERSNYTAVAANTSLKHKQIVYEMTLMKIENKHFPSR